VTELINIDAVDYHDDNIEDRPSLSASLIHILCTKSPAHAWAAHPKLNPNYERVYDVKFDIGTAVHALMLEGDDVVRLVNYPDWRTNAAKDERDQARSEGKIPLLVHQAEDLYGMHLAFHKQLEQHDADPTPFTEGQSERTIVWEERGVLCRARLDWLRDDRTIIDDYKTTSASARPEAWARTAFNIGADIQVAFYLRGLRALNERDSGAAGPALGSRSLSDPQFRFVVQETYAPYALSVVTLSPAALAIADAKVDIALKTWRRCLERGVWPPYSRQVARIEAPPWEMHWLENEEFASEVRL